jgi:hypothetical protein
MRRPTWCSRAVQTQHRERDGQPDNVVVPLRESIAGHVCLTGRAANVPDVRKDWRYNACVCAFVRCLPQAH